MEATMNEVVLDRREKLEGAAYGDFAPPPHGEAFGELAPTALNRDEPELEPICAASFASKDVPRREWLVADLIPANTVTVLSGDGEVGKSILALQLGSAVALGKDWIGTAPELGPVIYLSAEDSVDEVHRRL